jgi:uncharacterized protein (DUF1684 family)
MAAATDFISLAGWRRTVAELYAAVRESDDPQRAWEVFVNGRNELFKEHTQTPLLAEQRRSFRGLPYYEYDPLMRVMGRVKYDSEPDTFRIELKNEGVLQLQRVASIHFRLADRPRQLTLFWVLGYGGGLFLPFRDSTNGAETYGGGRYLYDTIKGADLGAFWETIVLDFNFAYNPSCAYDARWSCPLAPQENTLAVAVEAGEKKWQGTANSGR